MDFFCILLLDMHFNLLEMLFVKESTPKFYSTVTEIWAVQQCSLEISSSGDWSSLSWFRRCINIYIFSYIPFPALVR